MRRRKIILLIPKKHMIYCVLFLTLTQGELTDSFGFPYSFRFLSDVLCLLLLTSSMISMDSKPKGYMAHAGKTEIALIVYSLINTISAVINLVTPNLVIWAIRNTYRFIVFYYACIRYLDKRDVERIFEGMYKLQWVNMILVAYQYIGLGLKQDRLGGIFGHGGNAGMLIYSILLMTYSLIKYTTKEYSIRRMLFVLISTCIITTLAEIRIYYLFMILMVVIYSGCFLDIGRKIVLGLGAIVMLFGMINIYSMVFPMIDLSIDAFISEGISIGGGYNISRLNAFSDINKIIFRDNTLNRWIGLGFGNCEASTFGLFTSEFYRQYGHLNYRWFAHQWIYLETGYAGVVSYLLILVCMVIEAMRDRRSLAARDRGLVNVTIYVGVCCVILFFYNSLLKADYAYLVYFALAVARIVKKDSGKREELVGRSIDV